MAQPSKALSLTDFARTKKVNEMKANCVVCQLPAEIRQQISLARSRKVERSIIVEWLHGQDFKVDEFDFTAHANGQHDQREARAVRK
jgi:hypothetical protein